MDLKHLPRRAAGGFAISPYESKIEIGAHNQRLSHVMSRNLTKTLSCYRS